jgi:hypothetical protein
MMIENIGTYQAYTPAMTSQTSAPLVARARRMLRHFAGRFSIMDCTQPANFACGADCQWSAIGKHVANDVVRCELRRARLERIFVQCRGKGVGVVHAVPSAATVRKHRLNDRRILAMGHPLSFMTFSATASTLSRITHD